MKILADDKIPFVKELFGEQAAIVQKPGTQINSTDLKDIDVLLVRTVTRVDRNLLHHTNVRFVGTATAGIDHLDTDYLKTTGIRWFSAKGANAPAVVNYVLACIAALQAAQKLPQNPSLGIIGVGEVGSRLATALSAFSSRIVLNDPLRAAQENDFVSTPLNEFLELDLISLHTPLTKSGAFPSYHLLNENLLKRLQPKIVLINTARGGVIDESALMHLKKTPILCLDVWENEPLINLELMQKCFIATPHIAGYSFEAKARASFMLYDHFRKLFNWPLPTHSRAENFTPHPPKTLAEILRHYDPRKESLSMKHVLTKSQNPAHDFENLRRHYPLRQEF